MWAQKPPGAGVRVSSLPLTSAVHGGSGCSSTAVPPPLGTPPGSPRSGGIADPGRAAGAPLRGSAGRPAPGSEPPAGAARGAPGGGGAGPGRVKGGPRPPGGRGAGLSGSRDFCGGFTGKVVAGGGRGHPSSPGRLGTGGPAGTAPLASSAPLPRAGPAAAPGTGRIPRAPAAPPAPAGLAAGTRHKLAPAAGRRLPAGGLPGTPLPPLGRGSAPASPGTRAASCRPPGGSARRVPCRCPVGNNQPWTTATAVVAKAHSVLASPAGPPPGGPTPPGWGGSARRLRPNRAVEGFGLGSGCFGCRVCEQPPAHAPGSPGPTRQRRLYTGTVAGWGQQRGQRPSLSAASTPSTAWHWLRHGTARWTPGCAPGRLSQEPSTSQRFQASLHVSRQ